MLTQLLLDRISGTLTRRKGSPSKLEQYDGQSSDVTCANSVESNLNINHPKTSQLFNALRLLLEIVTLLSLLNYLANLIHNTIVAQSKGPRNLVWPCVFVVAKFCQYGTQIIEHCWGIIVGTLNRRPPRPRLRVKGDCVPSVDIIVTVCGEDHDIILDTVKAACTLDYPSSKLRVIVSDDGSDKALKAQIEDLNRSCVNVFYYARNKSSLDHHGFKAGNINSTVHFLAGLVGRPAPWIAFLDADMIPEPAMLRALLPHAVAFEDVGMVALPQHFYNIPADDPLHQGMLPHSEDDEVARDSLNATWCPGSGFILRRKAFIDIGGFSEVSIAEDVLFSWTLQGHGWRTIYVNERLQYGLQPDTISGHIKQRTKWCVGHIRNSLFLRFCISSPLVKQMNYAQRLAAFTSCINPWVGAILYPLWWCLILICLMGGRPFVPASTSSDLRRLLRNHLLFCLVNRLHEYISSIPYGYRTFRRKREATVWLAPYLTKAVLLELLPASLGGTRLGFTATCSMRARIRERDAQTRPQWFERVLILHRTLGIGYHALFLLLVVGLAFLGVRSSSASTPSSSFPHGSNTTLDSWYPLLTSVLFPGLGFEELPAFIAPFLDAMFSPIQPPRRELMIQQRETGVWRPRRDARDCKQTMWSWTLEVPQLVMSVWAIYVTCALAG